MQEIEVNKTGRHEYDVAVVQEDGNTTSHHVWVPPRLRVDLGAAPADDPRLVHESFSFLLEREPATAILGEFGLDVISRYFPEYEDEIRARLS